MDKEKNLIYLKIMQIFRVTVGLFHLIKKYERKYNDKASIIFTSIAYIIYYSQWQFVMFIAHCSSIKMDAIYQKKNTSAVCFEWHGADGTRFSISYRQHLWEMWDSKY